MLLLRAKSYWKWTVLWDLPTVITEYRQTTNPSLVSPFTNNTTLYLDSHLWLESCNIFLWTECSNYLTGLAEYVFVCDTGEWLTQSNISLEVDKRSSNQVSLVLLRLIRSETTEQEAVRSSAKHYHTQALQKCGCLRAGAKAILSVSFFFYLI